MLNENDLAAWYQRLNFGEPTRAITLDYNSSNGKRQVVRHAPDFFVLRQDAAEWGSGRHKTN